MPGKKRKQGERQGSLDERREISGDNMGSQVFHTPGPPTQQPASFSPNRPLQFVHETFDTRALEASAAQLSLQTFPKKPRDIQSRATKTELQKDRRNNRTEDQKEADNAKARENYRNQDADKKRAKDETHAAKERKRRQDFNANASAADIEAFRVIRRADGQRSRDNKKATEAAERENPGMTMVPQQPGSRRRAPRHVSRGSTQQQGTPSRQDTSRPVSRGSTQQQGPPSRQGTFKPVSRGSTPQQQQSLPGAGYPYGNYQDFLDHSAANPE